MRHRMLAVSAVLGTLLLAGCRTSTVPGSAYDGAAASAGSSARSSVTPSASSPAPRASASASTAVLTVRKTRLGYVLANASGFTIYWYARDHRGSARPACTGSCLLAWLPVTGHPVAASGVTLSAVLGTITRPSGLVQATYNGYPLYTFGSDSAPGQTNGNGSGGAWHVIREKAPGRSAASGSTSGQPGGW
jgi:predicted lipoprotein with Yx(FWY)xxD motif